jgi:hypothetical protein
VKGAASAEISDEHKDERLYIGAPARSRRRAIRGQDSRHGRSHQGCLAWGCEGPMQAFNLQNSHLRFALGFIGTTDVEIIAVAGITLGPGVDEKAASSALARVDT